MGSRSGCTVDRKKGNIKGEKKRGEGKKNDAVQELAVTERAYVNKHRT